jgi:hypothetical protein
VERYRFENSNFVRASSLHNRSLRHRLRPTPPPDNRSDDADADAEGVEAMPMTEPPPPPCCAGGALGLRGREPGPCRACPSRFA